ncbi:MAG: hypothetical protein KIT17_01165 [Rubrivivax sp.]|nr:hypothetical protein [Rubrivivax sp.]
MQDRAPLVWPTLPGVPSTTQPALASRAPATQPTQASTQDSQDVWEYLAEHIDDFAVAKSICDYFDEHPKDLHTTEVDALGLVLRARVTLKRQQIAYAETQKALAAAEQSSRSLHGRVARVLRSCHGVRNALLANPAPALFTCVLALWAWLR